MPLAEKSFDELVNDQVNAMQASARQLLDFSQGSIMLAIVESNAGNSLWLEGLYAFLLSVTRLQTSHGNDVDTFVEQFGLYRDLATQATGSVTFSRASTTQPAIIQAGTLEEQGDAALVFAPLNGMNYWVYADITNPDYDPDLNAYVIPSGISSISAPIIAQLPGSIGNVPIGAINTIRSPIPYVDTVINPDPLDNGADEETDAALKNRFVLYINSLSKATEQSLEATILGVPGVARYQLVENEDIYGNPYLGFFYAVIDDGTGAASSELLGNVQAALYAVRGFSIAFSVYAPEPLTINYVVHVFTDGSVPDSTVQSAVETALANYTNTRSFSSLLAWSDIARVVYETNSTFTGNQDLSPIINVTNWTQNSGTSDITLTGRQIPIPGTITVVMNA